MLELLQYQMLLEGDLPPHPSHKAIVAIETMLINVRTGCVSSGVVDPLHTFRLVAPLRVCVCVWASTSSMVHN